MKVLFVHPSPLMYSEIYLRLEPLGLELVAQSARKAGHDVRLLDLQVFRHRDYFRLLDDFKPEAIGFSLNYLANIPEVVDLAKETRRRLPECFIFAGGHSASFTAKEILAHAEGAISCVVRGEGEAITPNVLEAANDPDKLRTLPGVTSIYGDGPAPRLVENLNATQPARDMLARRRKYFIGVLDPCASIEFTRGCPWDCSFCSAWTFYGRNYRKLNAEVAAEDLASIQEHGVFIVDDVAFIQSDHGLALAREVEKRNIKKEYYLETRGDVLVRNKEVFKMWKRLGLKYMFLGLEAIDDDGLKLHRKRSSMGVNFKALEVAREIGLTVAINIIADPSWDRERFKVIRNWCMEIPEIVNISVNTPYPGTESWRTESRNINTRDYRLFDIQHAVMPTRLPLPEFYKELVETQRVLSIKHLGLSALREAAGMAAARLVRGQTNFVKMLWKFNSVYNPELQIADHNQPVKYEISMPPARSENFDRKSMYIHAVHGRSARQIDNSMEQFVNETRMGAAGE